MTALPNCKKKRRNTHLNSNRDIFLTVIHELIVCVEQGPRKGGLAILRIKIRFSRNGLQETEKASFFPGDDRRCVT